MRIPNQTITPVRARLDTLDDRFSLLPLQAIGSQPDELIESADDNMVQASAGIRAGPAFRTVPEEHYLEVRETLVGAAFVLGQAAITQAISTVKGIKAMIGDPEWFLADKAVLMALGAPFDAETGLSRMVLIDAVANYFKHLAEWPHNWTVSSLPPQRQAMESVIRLGLRPNSDTNLWLALGCLGYWTQLRQMGEEILAWRERLAGHLRELVKAHHIGYLSGSPSRRKDGTKTGVLSVRDIGPKGCDLRRGVF